MATLLPDALLPPNTGFTVALSTEVMDVAGNSIGAPFAATFSTGTGDDTARPAVVSVDPPYGATGASALTTVTVRVNEPLDPISASASTFRLMLDWQQSVPIDVTLADGDMAVVLTPRVPLFAGRNYAVRASGARDVARNPLANFDSYFTTALGPGTGALPSSAQVVVNPPSLFANGTVPTTVVVSSIMIGSTLVPNGNLVGVTAEPAFAASAGCTVSGANAGVSVDGRFLLFETLGARINFFCTPPDLTGLAASATATATVQIASVDSATRPVALIASGNLTLLGVGSATIAANPSSIPANGTSTSTLTVTVRDRDGNLVPDGTPVGLTAAPVYARSSADGSIIDGSTSTGDSRVQVFTTASGGFVATYRAPGSRGSGSAVIQALTLDSEQRPTSLAGTTSISLQ